MNMQFSDKTKENNWIYVSIEIDAASAEIATDQRRVRREQRRNFQFPSSERQR
jgi:hypothetical protein